MKKISFITLALMSMGISNAQKVDFRDITWQEANEQAASENKYIFVDAYTTWCGWCKVMDKETFTDPEVYPFINEHFIPMKIDFEDSLGIVLSMKFRVWAYPTTLVFNPQGQLVGKLSGYNDDHAEWVGSLRNLLDIKEERVFAFDSKNLDMDYPEFFRSSFSKNIRKWPTDSTVNAYMKGQQDLFSEVNWSVLLKFQPTEYQEFVLNNKDEYSKRYGNEEVSEFINTMISRYVHKAIKETNPDLLQKAIDLCDMSDHPEEMKMNVRMAYYSSVKDWNGFVNALGEFIELKGYSDHMTINNNCWTIYENVEDKAILKQAIDWMQPVIEAEPIWMYLDTYAALFYKYGDLDSALKYADIAIAAGEKAGEKDISSTRELRDKIRKAMKEK